MARRETHPEASESEKNARTLSFHLGGLFRSLPNFLRPLLSLSLSLSRKDDGERVEHNATHASPPMRIRGKPLAPSLYSLSRLLPLLPTQGHVSRQRVRYRSWKRFQMWQIQQPWASEVPMKGGPTQAGSTTASLPWIQRGEPLLL